MTKPKHMVVVIVALLCGTLPAMIAAQTRERFGISAKAGGVNAVVGRVMVTRQGQQPQLLSSTDNLTAGETVTAGSSSNAEILLNPGSYLRLSENSEFHFEDISLDNLGLRLLKGSVIIEATGVADMDVGIKVTTVHGEFTIIRSGVYRIDVQSRFAELAVRKGRAGYGPNKTDIVKGGKVVTLSNGVAVVAKLDKAKDPFDLWSKQRAEFLAKANARLLSRTFNGYLATFSERDSWFSASRRFGLWTYSPRAGCYTFLPFYYGWSSPYGHYYGSYYWRGGCCNNWGSTIVQTPITGPVGTGGMTAGGSGGGAGGGGTTSPSPPISGGNPTPPRGIIRDMDGGARIRKLDP
jgi:FecR protein